MNIRIAAIGLLASALVACSNDDGSDSSAPGVDAASLCVSSSCGEREVLLQIPSAENLHFTADGRLFVSSGTGFFEIVRDTEGTFRNIPAYEGTACGFTGIASRNAPEGEYLYVACGDGTLWGGAIGEPTMLHPIFQIEGMCIANGMTMGADGNLYVVDEPLNFCVPDPKIVRIRLDGADPLHVVGQEVWVQGSPLGQLHLNLDNVLRFPNGLQADGDRFYGTDGGTIYAVDLQPDGSAGEVQPLYFEVAIHDDLGLVPGGILATDFGLGRIFLLSREGELLQETDRGLFSFPSSVRLGRPPMFAADDILVTETGVLTDNNLPIDYLSVFRRR
ncbi:MAG: hypothetical protein WC809_00920 [Sinimarinibacterium sp.]|jgi:sugar lactone lactonase YvrE